MFPSLQFEFLKSEVDRLRHELSRKVDDETLHRKTDELKQSIERVASNLSTLQGDFEAYKSNTDMTLESLQSQINRLDRGDRTLN